MTDTPENSPDTDEWTHFSDLDDWDRALLMTQLMAKAQEFGSGIEEFACLCPSCRFTAAIAAFTASAQIAGLDREHVFEALSSAMRSFDQTEAVWEESRNVH